MELIVVIEPEIWMAAHLMDVLSSKENFNIFLRENIPLKKYDESCDTIIKLPKDVTKAERYQLHRYTVRDNFEPFSFDKENGDRCMEIFISKKYIQDIFKNYEFPEEIIEENELIKEEIELKSDKQMLFNTLIEFIEKNLSKEFNTYLKEFNTLS